MTYRLFPCRGRGITKRHLREKIQRYEERIPLGIEREIAQENPALYERIRRLVSSIPDIRPQGTLRLLEGENPPPQNNWLLVYEELRAMSRAGSEGEEERKLFEAILNEDEGAILDLSNHHSLVFRFFDTYPGLSWILKRQGKGMLMLYVGANLLDEIEALQPRDVPVVLPFIKNAEVMHILKEKNPRALKLPHFDPEADLKSHEDLIAFLEDERIGEALWTIDILYDPEYSHYRPTSDAEIDAIIALNDGEVFSFWLDAITTPSNDDLMYLGTGSLNRWERGIVNRIAFRLVIGGNLELFIILFDQNGNLLDLGVAFNGRDDRIVRYLARAMEDPSKLLEEARIRDKYIDSVVEEIERR